MCVLFMVITVVGLVDGASTATHSRTALLWSKGKDPLGSVNILIRTLFFLCKACAGFYRVRCLCVNHLLIYFCGFCILCEKFETHFHIRAQNCLRVFEH